MYYGSKKNRRVVIIVVWREADTKEVSEKNMGAVINEYVE
jgi:hypothetical protein